MQEDKVKRIVIIGLDGATWDVIDPMIQKGQLPNLQKIIAEGTRAHLKSLKVSFSPRIWTSIASGKTEDKHGIFNFKNNISDLKAKRIWDILSESGEKINIFYWYLTWPPNKNIDGFMVPGVMARDFQTVPSDLSFLKEIELSEKMKEQSAQGKTDIFSYIKNGFKAWKYGTRWSTFFLILKYVISRKLKKLNELDSFNELQLIKLHLFADVFKHVLKTSPVQFSAIMFPQPDQIGHKFWAYMEPDEFEKRTGEHVDEKERKKYGNVIYSLYQKTDKIIGDINQELTDQDILIVLSDHGFGLVQRSLASLKIRGGRFLEIMGLDKIANCFSVGSQFVIKLNEDVQNGNLEEIAKRLSEIKVVENDERLFRVTYESQEIVLELGDIFSMYLDDAQKLLKKQLRINNQVVQADEILVNRSDITGEHRELGVLIIKGKNVKKNHQIQNASVLDITPTVLYLKDLPVAEDMDGKILVESIEEAYLTTHPIKTIGTYEDGSEAFFAKDTDFSMTDALEARLKDLGYLD